MSEPRFERIEELPSAGQPVWYYPGATTTGGHNGILLRLYSRGGRPRTCMVAYDSYTCRVPGPFAMPDGAHIYVHGVLLNFDDPAVCEDVGVYPVWARQWSPSRREVVFQDYDSAVAYGFDGCLWRTGYLSCELTIERVTDTAVYLAESIYDEPITRRWTVDLQTGRIDGGLGSDPLP